ncbi:hypothetical protein KC322_g111 [Hortaea werneckii]|nr:hypothetical protein KC322_g111 [Hortaea werneckii]
MHFRAQLASGKHTDDVAGEESIDPAHDKTLRHHHGHIAFHGAHHALHLCRIAERVRFGFASAVRPVLQVQSFLCSRDKDIFSPFKGRFGDLLVRLFLWRRLEKRGEIMPENASQDHDNGDWEEDPIADEQKG